MLTRAELELVTWVGCLRTESCGEIDSYCCRNLQWVLRVGLSLLINKLSVTPEYDITV